MSEEEKSEEVVEEVAQEEQAPEETSDNVIFNALYNVSEEEEQAEEQEEYKPPQGIHEALHEVEVEEPEEKAEETAPVEEPEEKVAKPKPKQRVKRKIVDPEFKTQQPAPPPQVPVKEAADPYLEKLLPEEKEAYEVASWASQNVPEHKELAKNYLKFFKDHNTLLGQKKDEYDFADSDEYKNFLKDNKPTVNMRNLEREMWTAKAKEEAMKEIAPQLEQVRREQMKMRGEPVAKQSLEKTKQALMGAIPESYRESLQKSGLENFAKENPLEAQVINTHLSKAQGMAHTFYDIVNDVVDYNESNPDHAGLSKFIQDEQDKFIKTGRTQKNGKVFVRRERMPQVPPADKDKYYTFSDDDIVNLITKRAEEGIRSNIDQMHKAIQMGGWTKNGQPAPQPQAQAPAPKPPSMPQALTPSKGVSAPASGEAKTENPILNLLGL